MSRISWFSLASLSRRRLTDCTLWGSAAAGGGGCCTKSWGRGRTRPWRCRGSGFPSASPVPTPLLTLPSAGTGASCSVSATPRLTTPSTGPGGKPHGDVRARPGCPTGHHGQSPSALTVCRVVEAPWGEEGTMRGTPGSPSCPPVPPRDRDSPEMSSSATAASASAPSRYLLVLSPSSSPLSGVPRCRAGPEGGGPARGSGTCRLRSPSVSSSLLVQLPSSAGGPGGGTGTCRERPHPGGTGTGPVCSRSDLLWGCPGGAPAPPSRRAPPAPSSVWCWAPWGCPWWAPPRHRAPAAPPRPEGTGAGVSNIHTQQDPSPTAPPAPSPGLPRPQGTAFGPGRLRCHRHQLGRGRGGR